MLALIIIILLVGAFIIKTQSQLDLNSQEDRGEFVKQYSHWSKRIFGNIKSVTGHVVRLDWVPDKPYENENIQNTNNSTKII